MKNAILLAALTAAAATPLAAQVAKGRPAPAAATGITRQAAQAQITAAFRRADANGDGALTRAEADAAARRIGPGARDAGAMFDRADADGNGRATLAETMAGPMTLFDRADRNRDGRLEPAEQRAVMDAARKMRTGG